MKEIEHDFSDDIKINKYKLEIMCEEHASKYHYWAEKLAKAKNALNATKDSFIYIESQAGQYIRSNWDKEYLANFGKAVENSIRAAMEQDENIILAKKEIAKAQDEVNILSAAVSAFEHRKSELDNLVTLLVKGFYAAPNGGKREDPDEHVRRDIRKKMNKEK